MQTLEPCRSWTDAFDLGPSEHVALVGGGGKTTTLWSLARELSGAGPTIVTTTTKAGAPPADVPLVDWEAPLPDHSLHELVAAAFARSALIAVGSGVREGRLRAVSPEIADELFFRCGARYVVNEADGARMKPFKAPAEHEPVLASTTTLLVVVIGLDALGAPIEERALAPPRADRSAQRRADGRGPAPRARRRHRTRIRDSVRRRGRRSEVRGAHQ